MKKYLPLIIILLLILFLGASFFVIFETKVFFSRAKENVQSVSAEHSYVFVSPVEASCTEVIRINVFVVDQTGRPVIGTKVAIAGTDKISVKGAGITDNFGRALFDASCTNASDSYLPVLVNGAQIRAQAHIVFK